MSDAREDARGPVGLNPAEDRQWAREFYRALMLATDVETLEALLDGEAVPLERLDPEWVERFGRKQEQ